ncbi:VOC family protein [Piscibacillus sp. B03]|uniref:VOC family protein n=1 Tax=Piscibacillus sp. B03 TaxID=3457430 RepID=UPI003FCE8DE4
MDDVKSSVKTNVGGVFVMVENMPRAVKWYRELLDLPQDDQFINSTDANIKTIYSISLNNTELILDSMHRRELNPSSNHLFLFDTEDIEATYEKVLQKNIKIISPIEGEEGLKFFTIEDCEGNRFMFCEEE